MGNGVKTKVVAVRSTPHGADIINGGLKTAVELFDINDFIHLAKTGRIPAYAGMTGYFTPSGGAGSLPRYCSYMLRESM
jgi:hypothetical protein